jgi:bifunctional non-homologous end joining protein LigD
METYLAVDNLAGLVSLVQLNALEFHPWGARGDNLNAPDRLVFDLDPGQGMTWRDVISAAIQLRECLAELGLQCFVRTTGGRGLHLVAPLVRRTGWDELKEFAKGVADALVRQDPKTFVATASKAKRREKIFIDYLRNDRGATAIASYSTRARAGATVATPLQWDELTPQQKPEHLNILTVPQRLSEQRADPWKEFFTIRQSITKLMLRTIRAW